MQILPLSTGTLVGPQGTSQTGQTQQVPGTGAARPLDTSESTQTSASGHATPLRAASPATLERPTTLQVSRAQQAQSYLQALGSELEGLKSAASAQLAQPVPTAPGTGSVDLRLQRVQALWQQRAQASGGSLDNQLQLQADGEARRGFKVPGLDARSLQQTQGETLSFITGASPPGDRRIVTAVLTPGTSVEQQARALDLALAPAGVRLQLDGQGEVSLSSTEAQWPTVRDSFSVQGGGVRFPARQFHRLQATAQADVLNPQGWRTTDATALRETLQQIVPAQQRVRAALNAVQGTLDDQGRALQASSAAAGQDPAELQAWAEGFAKDFSQVGEQAPYAVFASLAPALQGVSRPRVEALLRQG